MLPPLHLPLITTTTLTITTISGLPQLRIIFGFAFAKLDSRSSFCYGLEEVIFAIGNLYLAVGKVI
jgi:hypothetical protein